ncbi:hypothetical protein O3G_MSEX011987 [Manduca sexta]|uniref:Adenylate cyclase n=1 Tax=Manduca sexta TaxID=7130 RepID=A0A921ZMM6_MANSE|nr:hypothetical protein O3G_MSEX011987 [Manduca sexta]
MASINIDKENKNPEEFTEEHPLKENDEKTEPEQKKSFCENCVYVLKNITVEPCIFLFISSAMITMLTTQNLNLEKACRVNLNFTDEICDALKAQQTSSQNDYERETQKLLASAMAWRTYLSATVPCLMALYIGSWSDITGHRKFFIMFPVFGQLLINLNNMIHVYFFKQLRLEYLVLSEAILEAFTGGWCVCFLSVFSYISAITTEKTRTYRLGLINFSMTVGFPVGMGLSGILIKNLGYYGCYSIAASFHLINFLYTVFALKDPKRNKEQKKHDRRGVRHFFRTFFDLTNVKDTLRVVFKKAPNNRRIRLCILLAVVAVLFGPIYGEVAVLYMSTRYRFNWDEVDFSIFQTYNFITHTVGTIFSILVFSKYLKWHDSILGIISTVSKFAASFVYCFAPNEKVFFAGEYLNKKNFNNADICEFVQNMSWWNK